MKLLRIASRESPLALWQANYVKQRLIEIQPDLTVQIVSMTTAGDQMLDRTLANVGGKGLFLKELEMSLLNKDTDIAVHSMKDVPVSLPDGLEIAVVCNREDARDAFVSNHYQNLYALPKGAIVGTSSLRRVAQLKSAFPELEFIELRGNVNTRLRKLDQGDYDAIVLASAGLIRLGLQDRIKQFISPELCLPAVGQGIIGIECRSDDDESKETVRALNDLTSALSIAAERSMNAKLEGGCQVPVAGFSEIEKGKIRLRGMVGSVDGSQCLLSDIEIKSMTLESAEELGVKVADDLLKQGAGEILSSFQEQPFELTKLQSPVVMLTRAEKYLGNTPSLLESLDYQSRHIPALKIEEKLSEEAVETFANIELFSDILFVSRNSVEVAIPVIQERGGLPDHLRVMAVGTETAKQLYEYGIDAFFPDQGNGAEALLRVKQLQDLTGRNILIIRGEKGLDWPSEEMQKRGGTVTTVKCYDQITPDTLETEVQTLLEGNAPYRVKGIFVHSSLSAKSILPHVIKYPRKIAGAKLIAGSEQIANTARDYGWENEIRIAESPSNKHMMIAFSGN